MATQETQLLDEVVAKGRRKLLTLGGTALAGMVLGASATKANAASYSDTDILNFALNLEYLEANFYYLCAFGTTINVANAASTAAGAPVLPITGQAGGGAAGVVTGTGITAAKVPFLSTASDIAIAAYCNETAVEEGKHVRFLQTAIGSSTYVAQPTINLGVGPTDAWPTLATAAGITGGSAFNPYASSATFLLGAYVFEDVGVTAYHGAASLLSNAANLAYAGGILAVEAYHAGLIRTSLYFNDTAAGSTTNATITGQISTLRNALAQAALLGSANKPVTLDPNPDDFGTATFVTPALGATGSTQTAARITNSDTTDSVNPIPLAIASARTVPQVLNIVTGGGAVKNGAVVSPATGVFFPNGLNGLFR